MVRSLLLLCTVVLLVTVGTRAEPDAITFEDARAEVLARIMAANMTLPSPGGGRFLQSYRIIDPYLIADLISSIAYMYSSVLYSYPDFLLYDTIDLKLFGVQYIPQRIEFNYVNRV